MSHPVDAPSPGKSRAPSSSQKVDLRAVTVPATLWEPQQRCKLVSVEKEGQTIGFVRVFPDVTLSALRSELQAQVEADSLPNSFVFLRNVGEYLALVSSKQEAKLTAKSFLPPSNSAPEIYLLPVEDLSTTSLSCEDGWASLSDSSSQLQNLPQTNERSTASPAAALSIPPQQPLLHRSRPRREGKSPEPSNDVHSHMPYGKDTQKPFGDNVVKVFQIGESPLSAHVLARPGSIGERKEATSHNVSLSSPSTYSERFHAQQEIKNACRTPYTDLAANNVDIGMTRPSGMADISKHMTRPRGMADIGKHQPMSLEFSSQRETYGHHYSGSHQPVEPLPIHNTSQTLSHDAFMQQGGQSFAPHPPTSPRLHKPRSPRLSPRPESMQALQNNPIFTPPSVDSGISSVLAQPGLPPVGQWAQPSPLQLVLTRGGNQVALQVHDSTTTLPALSPRSPGLSSKHFDIHIASPSPQPHLLLDDKVHVLAHSKQPLPPVRSSSPPYGTNSPPYSTADSSAYDEQTDLGKRLLSPSGAFASREAAMRQQLQELEQLKADLQEARQQNERLTQKRKSVHDEVAAQQAESDEWKKLYQQEKKRSAAIEKEVEQLEQEVQLAEQKATVKRHSAAGNLHKTDPNGQSDHPRADKAGSSMNNFRTMCHRLEGELKVLRQKKDDTETCLKKEQEALKDAQNDCKELRDRLTQKKITRSLLEKAN